MKLIKFPVFAICLGLALSAHAADRRKKEEAPPPPQFHVDVATRSMSMTQFVNRVPVGTIVGKFCFSLFCDISEQISSEHAFRGVPDQDFARLFISEAQAAGFNIAGVNKDLFASEDTARPELLVGAAITQYSARGRREEMIVTASYSLEANISVDWQVFDPLEKKILYRGTSQGAAKVSNGSGPEALPRDAARLAFREAAKIIVMDPNFLAAVKDPRGGAPAQPGALFPEASGLSTSPSAPQATPANTAIDFTQIAHLPLSTKPFRQQVKDLMKQVITVRTPSGTGSGFYIADSLILTNHHVINGYKEVRVKFFGSREIAGHVLTSDARRDVALIRTENINVPGLPLRTDQPEIASPTFVIGSPLDPKWEGSVISGIVSGFRDHEYGPMIQSDVQVTHGNSGGPMFDEHGNVIALVDIGYSGQDGEPTAIKLFIPVGDALAKLHIQQNLAAGAAPIVPVAMPAPASSPAQVASLSASPPAAPMRSIKVSMFPAIGPVKDSGHSNPLPAIVAGAGTSGTFTFARPDGVSCNGKWTTLQTKPASSLIEKYKKEIGLPTDTAGLVGGLAIGSCSNAASFQAEYYTVPTADSGFGAATDSDGNVYKLIF